MKLIFEFCISASLLDKILHFLHYHILTSLKAFRVMKNESTLRKCDLVLDIMIASLK